MTTATTLVDTVTTILVIAAFVGGLVALLERTHRRTARLSRTTFGADLEGDRDIVRTLSELDAARGKESEPAARPATSVAGRQAYRVRHP